MTSRVTRVTLLNTNGETLSTFKREYKIFNMENKIIKTNRVNRDLEVSKARLFLWQIQKEERKGNKILITLSRDNEVPYYQELVKLEEEYGEYKFFPFIAIIIPAIIAFLIITGLLIVYIISSDIAKNYWYAFLIPSAVCLFISMVLTFLRMRTFDQILNKKKQKDAECSAKIKKLKENCQKNSEK